jgi:NAD kinase
MTAVVPRVVLITRETEYERLLATHATRGQAAFFLSSRGQSIDELEARHQRFTDALDTILRHVPSKWRRNRVDRAELERFLFEPEDLVVAVGQDGLVANVAKYLSGQRVLGINPDQALFDGILVPFSAHDALQQLIPAMYGDVETQSRVMVEVSLDTGQQLLALNEIFIGHRSHQSARYWVDVTTGQEHQSSSGMIVATGTGATGWARSINRSRKDALELPAPEDRKLAYYVREAFPSNATGTAISTGLLTDQVQLRMRSEMNEGGVIFGDGIESDYLEFNWGVQAEVRIAQQTLELIVPAR